MPGIMNARRDFIDAQRLRPGAAGRVDDEHFDREHANVIERVGDGAGKLDRLRRRLRRDPRRARG